MFPQSYVIFFIYDVKVNILYMRYFKKPLPVKQCDIGLNLLHRIKCMGIKCRADPFQFACRHVRYAELGSVTVVFHLYQILFRTPLTILQY